MNQLKENLCKNSDLYKKMLLVSLDALLTRSERDNNYPFIDTKLSMISGCDFNAELEPHRGKNTVYAWIQGRGLEALAGHGEYISRCSGMNAAEKQKIITRIKSLLRRVIEAMETVRHKNNGRMHFCFNLDGKFLEIRNHKQLHPLSSMPSGKNTSELFYFKGLIAAAAYLGDNDLLDVALAEYDDVLNDIESKAFYSDRQQLDPQNQNAHTPGASSHGAWMVALGGIAQAARCRIEKHSYYLQRGAKFINYELDNHLNTGQYPELQLYDFTETIDLKGAPYRYPDGCIVCDPGHALEMIGLAMKVLLEMDADNEYTELRRRCRRYFPAVFCHVFSQGFNPAAGGIVKTYDLATRKFINTNMPWWNLPETMRAGAGILLFAPETEFKNQIIRNMACCSEAFIRNYLREDLHMMAYQTIDENSRPVDVIPATPDADPGYHTNLSIIDYLEWTNRIRKKSEGKKS